MSNFIFTKTRNFFYIDGNNGNFFKEFQTKKCDPKIEQIFLCEVKNKQVSFYDYETILKILEMFSNEYVLKFINRTK